MVRLTKEREEEIKYDASFPHKETERDIRELLSELAALRKDLAMAQSDSSVKHKHRADILENRCEQLKLEKIGLEEALRNLYDATLIAAGIALGTEIK